MNNNAPPVETLSEEALAEIEAQPSRLINGLEGILLSPAERDALCQSLRAAWANELRLAKELVDLREQLAENARRHFDDARSLERQRNEALDQCTELHQRLAQVEKERNDLQRHPDAVDQLTDRHLKPEVRDALERLK